MPVIPQNPASPPATTTLDLIADALMEIGALAQGETPTDADAQFVLRKLNRMLDQWNARKVYAYNVAFRAFTLVAGLAPHTIGPSGATFNAPRPVRIENAELILTNSASNVDVPLNIRDDDWWANQRVKSLHSNIPTDLYYSPDSPNGSLNFWPVPNFAYGVRLEGWQALAKLALTDELSLPPAYESGILYSLAEQLCTPFGKAPDSALAEQARRARVAIQGNNSTSPRTQTADFGTARRRRGSFNYYTGQ